jgi:hypothetical protein
MKAISLWQPWASLIATNWKHYETRSWATTYRGPLLIHAAKRTEECSFWFDQPEFKRHLQASGIKQWNDLPFGALVGLVNLVNVVRTEAIRHRLDKPELAFGNYQDGRFAWKLEFVQRIACPIIYRGAQGLFTVDISLEELAC